MERLHAASATNKNEISRNKKRQTSLKFNGEGQNLILDFLKGQESRLLTEQKSLETGISTLSRALMMLTQYESGELPQPPTSPFGTYFYHPTFGETSL